MSERLRLPTRSATVAGAALSAGLLAIGALLPVHPIAALCLVALTASGLLLVHARHLPALYPRLTFIVLIGYAFLGRGFAYTGQKPVFIGDIVLVVGALALVTHTRGLKPEPLQWLVLLFMAIGLARTLPYIGTYKIDAIRDAALWGYGAYALALSFLLEPGHIRRGIDAYRRLVPWLAAWIPLAGVVSIGHASPLWPNSGVPMIDFKGGDMGVHLTLIAAFILLGLYSYPTRMRGLRSESVVWLLWFIGLAPVIAMSRSSMLAVGFGLVTSFLLCRSVRLVPLALWAATLVAVLFFFNPVIPVGHGQNVSVTNLAQNAVSIFSNKQDQGEGRGGSHQNLQGSKHFRLAWWTKIVDYTIHGPYFWKGKGFGVNLADSDGFQIDPNHSLRAPHNSHITVLARMGVPGLTVWSLIQLTFGAAMLVWFRRARRAGARLWSLLDAWLFVAWLAIMIDATFDPYLEGPQGGIWLWSVLGIGMAAMRLQRKAFAEGRVRLEESGL